MAVLFIWGMLIGFLCSPALCSISVILFGFNGIRDIHPKLWFRQKWWLLTVVWIAIYAATWFWSTDIPYWNTRLQVKLPFLILPLAFAFLPKFNSKQLQIITITSAIIFLTGIIYSLSFLLKDFEYYSKGYHVNHLLPTPVRGDHIRFSMALALFVVWCCSVWNSLGRFTIKWFIGLSMSLIIIYIHILAAKSGLISIYVFVLCFSFYLLSTKRKIFGLLLIFGFAIIFFLSSKYIPTLATRIGYTNYSIAMAKTGDRSGNYGDIGRLMSYQMAWNVIKKNPIIGVGIGNMLHAMKDEYKKEYPLVPDVIQLLPHNQFLIVAIGCGIPALLYFMFWYFYPLASVGKNKESFYFIITWVLLLFQLLIEPVFEVQYGVFVYLYFIFMQYKLLPIKKILS